MDLSFLQGNPFYIAIAFIIFHSLIGQPFFDFDIIHSALLFAALYVLYKKYGNGFLGKVGQNVSSFGRRR